jgi:hypothetical protein
MAELKILLDLEVDVNENCEIGIDPVLGELIRRLRDLMIKEVEEVEEFCQVLEV